MNDLMKIIEEKQNQDHDKLDFKKLHDQHFVDLNKPLQKPPIAVSIGTNAFGFIPFGSYGDYSCIVGQSKSRKTFFKSAVIAGYIGHKAQNYFPTITGHQSSMKYVIDIDTEQSAYHSKRVFKRVEQMVGAPIPQYKGFALRTMEAAHRLQFIEWLIYESPYRDKIGLISIDGYADLINDFNSLEQSTDLTQKLMKWSAEGKCHITGVLHLNFGSQKPVGHVGSSVLKKAETIIFVEPVEDGTLVTCKYSRNMPFEDLSFEINDEHLPKEIII